MMLQGNIIECPPPITIDTVGFDKEFIISAIAKPASTSPPTVFNTINTPFTFHFFQLKLTGE